MAPLTVIMGGDGEGNVVSVPAGIQCPGTCTAEFPVGEEVILSPVARNGAVFTTWKGACSSQGACAVTVDGPTSATAMFQHWIGAKVYGSGSSSVASGLAVKPVGDAGLLVVANLAPGGVKEARLLRYDFARAPEPEVGFGLAEEAVAALFPGSDTIALASPTAMRIVTDAGSYGWTVAPTMGSGIVTATKAAPGRIATLAAGLPFQDAGPMPPGYPYWHINVYEMDGGVVGGFASQGTCADKMPVDFAALPLGEWASVANEGFADAGTCVHGVRVALREASGAISWERLLHVPGEAAVTALSDGTFVVVAGSQATRMNRDGNVLWTREVGGTWNGTLARPVQAPNGDVLVGSVRGLTRIRLDGEVAWESRNLQSYCVNGITVDDNEFTYVTGGCNPTLGTAAVVTEKVDPLGNVL